MKLFTLLLALAILAAAVLFGTEIGDTYQHVIKEKGNPRSQIDAGSVRQLTYPDMVIKLKDNIVVAIKATPQEPTLTVAKPAPLFRQSAPESNIVAVKQQLDATVRQIMEIVNQDVPAFKRQPGMRLFECYYHDGATRPDFGNVDVRATRETPYNSYEYILWKGREDVVWATKDLEFNPMTKYFYVDRSVPKKKLTDSEMEEINRLYREIARCEQQLTQLGYKGEVP